MELAALPVHLLLNLGPVDAASAGPVTGVVILVSRGFVSSDPAELVALPADLEVGCPPEGHLLGGAVVVHAAAMGVRAVEEIGLLLTEVEEA
jgi:hypothetical protein